MLVLNRIENIFDTVYYTSSINQFDVYVGTSAGAFIASLCANGVTPEEMMRVVTRQGKLPFKDIDLSDLLRPNVMEIARKGALMPWRAVRLAREMVAHRGSVSLMDAVMGLAEGLPSGAYTGAGIESYLGAGLGPDGRVWTSPTLPAGSPRSKIGSARAHPPPPAFWQL